MRQQYHHRYTDKGRLVWDVKKLVEMTKDFPVIDVAISAIQELDETFWYQNDEEAQPTCKDVANHAKLIEDTDLSYPIILCSQGRVMDGMHRVCKAYLTGQETVKAVQFEKDPEPDYLDVSLDDLPYDD